MTPVSENEFNIFADISLKLDGIRQMMKNQIDQRARRNQQRLASLPVNTFLWKNNTGAAAETIDFGGPTPGYVWVVKQLSTIGNPIGSGSGSSVMVQSSAVAAGAAAGAVSLPAGAYLSGVDISFLPATGTLNGDITITGVAGGTITYRTGLATGAVGTNLNYEYEPALPPANPAVPITLNVPAIVGGPAYSMLIFGQQTTPAAVATWYVGNIVTGPAVGQPPTSMARYQQTAPTFSKVANAGIRVLPGEKLIVGLTSVPASTTLTLGAIIESQPLYAQIGPVAVE